MIRREVAQFTASGPLPAEECSSGDQIKEHEDTLLRISPPVSDEEARVLVRMFGPDDCFGLAWALVHLIETAPGWPLTDCLRDSDNQWIRHSRQAADNG